MLKVSCIDTLRLPSTWVTFSPIMPVDTFLAESPQLYTLVDDSNVCILYNKQKV